MPCLTDQQADDYQHNRLDDGERGELARHLAECAACRARVGDSPTAGTVNQTPHGSDEEQRLHASLDDLPVGLRDSKRYPVLGRLGSGGMGVVYRAMQVSLEREVALKVMRPHLVANAAAVERFRREARAVAKLKHPNIVVTYDAEQEGDAHFIVMELVEGVDLSSLVKKKGPLAASLSCHLARQVALALHHAHEKGMVHRDVKPQNLMTARDGRVTVLDFGLARLAHEGGALSSASLLLGTPEYMAPEQASSPKSVDGRADLYSLGCTLYHLLSGRPPFERETEIGMEVVVAHALHEPTPLRELRHDIPAELAALVARLMAKRREGRPTTAAEAARELLPFAEKKERPKKSKTAAPPPEVTVHRDFVNWSVGRMVYLKGGRFRMGSPDDETGRGDDEKLHWVTVSPLYLAATPVTQGQFRLVMGYNPSYFARNAAGGKALKYRSDPGGGADKLGEVADTEGFPVENVSWQEASEFCERLNLRDATRLRGWVYRLPREAEWEFACRAGAVEHHVFSFGDVLDGTEARANFDSRHPYGSDRKSRWLGRTCKVGSYKANAFGLYDMHGNVWEWCQDWYGKDYYPASDGATDPPGPGPGADSLRVMRGGGWNDFGESCRSANRDWEGAASRFRNCGFRVALVPAERG